MHTEPPEEIPSLGQERSWFIAQYVDAPVEHCAVVVRLRGDLDLAALSAAVSGVSATHDVLRATFVATDGVVHVVPGPQPHLAAVRDLTGGSGNVPDAVEAAVAARFDMARGPLLRVEPLRVATGEHLLVVVAHRAIADPVSLRLIVAEMGERYAGERPVAPAAGRSFAAVAAAERTAAESGRGDAGQRWRDHLADLPPIELPTDRSRGVVPRYAADAVAVEIGESLVAACRALATSRGATANDIFRAVFEALLHHYSGQPAFALGVAVPRRDVETARLVGPLTTWNVRRSELPVGTSLADLLGEPVDQPPALPFEAVVDAVQPVRDPTRSPLFQAAFTGLDPAEPARFGDLEVIEETVVPGPATLYDLDLLAQPAGAGVRLTLTFRTDLFDRATVERMLQHLHTLLGHAVADPDADLMRLPYLDDAERERLLIEFNRTDVPYPADATVQNLFEEQVLRTPENRAVTLDGRHLTYQELNDRANRLAHHLRAIGVGRGTLVALCLERSFDLIVAVLAVLKSGGAYVPLDPAYPRDRLAYTLADTGAKIVLTQRKLRDTPPVDDDALLLVLDDAAVAAEVAAQPADNPVDVNEAGDLTYIVYTSGSTGRPKGVETTHQGVARLVINTDILELDERTSYLQISPLSFDACTLEIYGPLLNGGRVVLLPPELPTPARVARTVREQGVDTLWLVAPLANLTIDAHLDDLRGLRQFMAGGDVLSIPHIRQVLERLPHVRMVNGYGPTEVTAFSVSHKIDYVDSDWVSIPIGRPMHNTTAYILDEFAQPTGIGVWGELYLGGPGVALGYHNRPDLNAERFLPDTFRPGPGHQLYRTGDRCRWLPDGTIQFHGRLDTQVKIDGLRVELGEIQSTVADHPSVAAAVVTAPVVGARRQLVAYVVPTDPGSFDAKALRSHLAGILPSVMVPAHYITLETIPLNPNNQVNFHALPAPEFGSAGRRPPETDTQQALAEIWEEMLGISGVGLDDNFFDCGGQSLRAIPMIAAISMRFGVDLAVQDVFEAPVLEALATRIEERILESVAPEDLERMLADIGG